MRTCTDEGFFGRNVNKKYLLTPELTLHYSLYLKELVFSQGR